MYCNQCEETVDGKVCGTVGVCGKNEVVSGLQDELIIVAKNIARNGPKNNVSEKFIIEALFLTVTNVNFDSKIFQDRINEGKQVLGDIKISQLDEESEDIKSLKEIILYGLKGLSAYLHHAIVLNYTDQEIVDFVIETMAKLTETHTVDELIGLVLQCGEYGVKTMALLDKANTETYGNPEPTEVNIGVRNNPGILISGHDLKDLKMLLEQTKDSGVDVYTHGEMLPANSYPDFKKYENFVGNYGGSWWKQKEEFERFNGPILMTTNCIVPPAESYKGRVYTTGLVGFEGLKYIASNDGVKDFSTVIEHAKKCTSPDEIETGTITGGFAHKAALAVAGKIIEAIQGGKIKRFVVMAGCDGRNSNREYYTKFAKELPQDTVILTAGCAKFRYNKLGLGDIDGIPRVIDAGQCNDSYSLVVVAQKLAEALGIKDLNELPISYNIAWYEQKAVLVLLALLHLGVKNIRLGPRLPAFVSPNVLKVLVDKFNIGGITGVEEDIKALVP